MRPFALFGVFMVVIGALSLLFALLAYSADGGACLGGRTCPSGYAAWYEGRVLIWGLFGGLLLVFGLWLVARPRRRWGAYGGPGGGPGGGPYGPRRGGWGYAGGGGGGPRFCPKCGARNGPHFQFCHRCGSPLGGPSAPATPPLPPR